MKVKILLSILISGFFSLAQTTQGNWQISGPILFPTNVSGQIHGIGRVSQIKFHATDSQKIYAVSASGGLWISTNSGSNWNKTGTDTEIPQGSCSSVCIDYTNDQTIYLSTGDANYYSNNVGIYKSTDGGQTWSPAKTGIGNRMALEILQAPTDPNVLIAATSDGIFKTTDGGQTWVEKLATGDFCSMTYKSASNTTLFATTHDKLFTSLDNGETWIQNMTVIPPAGNGGRVAVTAADTNVVYLAFVGTNNSSGDGGIIYQSTDGGSVFNMVKGDQAPNLNGYEAFDYGQGNYNWNIFADQLDATRVYVCGHVVWESTNSGVDWTQMTNWWEKCHTDMHQIIISPYDNSKMFNINDGGIFISTDGGSNWIPSADGLSATEIYHMGQSNLSRNIVSIGTQDNGELYMENNTWYCNRGGDWGSVVSFDYSVPDRAYYHENGERRELLTDQTDTYYSGTNSNSKVIVFTDLNTSFALMSDARELYQTYNLMSPNPDWQNIKTFTTNIKSIAISPVNENEIYVLTVNRQVHYSSDGGASFIQISYVPNPTSNFGKLVITPYNDSVLYATCGTKVYRSTDKGYTWTNYSGTLSSINIINLIHDPYSIDESMYLATAYGVYFRNKNMLDWQPFSVGLPLIAQITDMFAYFDGTDNSTLRVSFYGRGVWESDLYPSAHVSTEEIKMQESFISIYPNPGSDIITIRVMDPSLIQTEASLYDLNGKLLSEIKIMEPITLIDFSEKMQGLYLLKFKNGVTERIVIKK